MVKRLISATRLLAVVMSGVSIAQRGQTASEQEQWILGDYWAVVKKYQAGQTAPAIKEMSSWPQDRIAKVDRKSTRLNSSHSQISYAVFCLKKKTKEVRHTI